MINSPSAKPSQLTKTMCHPAYFNNPSDGPLLMWWFVAFAVNLIQNNWLLNNLHLYKWWFVARLMVHRESHRLLSKMTTSLPWLLHSLWWAVRCLMVRSLSAITCQLVYSISLKHNSCTLNNPINCTRKINNLKLMLIQHIMGILPRASDLMSRHKLVFLIT